MGRRVGDQWVGGGPVGESEVSGWWSVGQWSTFCWVNGRLLVVGGSVKHLPVGRRSVIGEQWVGVGPIDRSVVGCRWSVVRR